MQCIHCNLCVLLYCMIHAINVLLRIIRKTLKTNTGKIPQLFISNKTLLKETKKDQKGLNPEKLTNQISYMDLGSVPKWLTLFSLLSIFQCLCLSWNIGCVGKLGSAARVDERKNKLEIKVCWEIWKREEIFQLFFFTFD